MDMESNMTQADTDKLVDELIDAKSDLAVLQGRYDSLRDDFDTGEEAYRELARDLGFNAHGPLVSFHFDIVSRAKELAAFARVA